MKMNFKQIVKEVVTSLRESIQESKRVGVDYLTFLLEDNISLGQFPGGGGGSQKKKDSWADVWKGFDVVKDIPTRKKFAKEGRKMRGKLFGDPGSNPKLAKETINAVEYQTIGLSLSPANESGRLNLCSHATPECAAACLNKSGHGGMGDDQIVQVGRRARTDFMIDHPSHFAAMVHDEIDAHERYAAKRGLKPAVRLNVVSDIPWEVRHPEIFTQHPNVQFYDYTKIHSRLMHPDGTPKPLPSNYHLTYSSTGIHAAGNWPKVRQHLDNGGVSAMVFAIHSGTVKKEGGPLPSHVIDEKTGKKYRVIDADKHDHRHLDHLDAEATPGEGLIAGLRIKGKEKLLKKAGDFAVKVQPGETTVTVPDIHD